MSEDTSIPEVTTENNIESSTNRENTGENEDSTHSKDVEEDSIKNTDSNSKNEDHTGDINDPGGTDQKMESKGEDDEILSLFLNEINTIDKLGKVEYDNKNINLDANQICLRLTSQTFSTPYQVLQLKHDATEEEIKQRYYKLSLLIHPDKCQNDKAPQAFQVLKDAYNEMKKEDIREKYKEIYEDAKAVVYRRHKIKPDTTQLELYAAGTNIDLKKFDSEIEKECVNILNKQKERREYAEKCIQANIQYEKNIQSNLMDLEREKLNQQVEWDKTRDIRVNSWKQFQNKIDANVVKINKFKPVVTKKENRDDLLSNNKSIILTQADRLNKRKKIVNTEGYKQNWK
ncbi:ubiquitin-conjugating enzyme [Theileria orientalis]|uniref:Ubiquitin-conjugating enzyme n=1 Tax=Theileria orientalis TaxID=68886 RepID=A0A976M654_THEOR|nr:ubiquitin-conjugating enzyme [Theileria orientalis]